MSTKALASLRLDQFLMFRRILSAAAVAAACTLGLAQEKPPAPNFAGDLHLVRYDMPRGLSNGFAPTRQLAKRRDAADAVEWPTFTLNGKQLFRNGPTERVPLTLRTGPDAKSPFRTPQDPVLRPGDHWFRPVLWFAGRKHLYTADPTARCSSTSNSAVGVYELWLFPLRIQGEGAPQVKNVVVKQGGAVIFQKDGPWRSLTLLLPSNPPGAPYEVSVDGRGPVKCTVGLAAVKLGNPVERSLTVNTQLPGGGGKIRIFTPGRSEVFPNAREWAADEAAAAKFKLPARQRVEPFALRDRFSPMTIYAAALPHGLSGGFWRKGMKADEYARQFSRLGFDAIFDPSSGLAAPGHPESIETRASAFARNGIRMGLQYDQNWSRPDLQHPNLAFLAHTLPEWHQPLYRSLQLAAQRFSRIPAFFGLMIGGDNAGYMALTPQHAPNPDRPWGEAMLAFSGSATPSVPRAPSLGSPQFPFEKPVKTQAEFLRYVQRYDNAFHQYGYLAEAVREAAPAMAFTTASYGSSPGIGARGGWPWASAPGRVIFEGLRVQQAYDTSTAHSSKPMHLVALLDRLRSYHPTTPTWALVDNYKLFFGREAMQRAYALALTRGVRGIGTNFPATAGSENLRPELAAAQRELHDWIHRYGASYAAAQPEPTIGIFFSALQAVQRPVDPRSNPPAAELLAGSHEGKVTEALWLCHAAGWPARVVTHQEVLRGPLPSSMKALLLVGLEDFDASWQWARSVEKMLRQFTDRGGRILLDETSSCPAPATKTGMKVAAYGPQAELDMTPRLLARNGENIRALRAAMKGIEAPMAASDDPLTWVLPTRVGDTQFVTAVNWAFAEGEEAKEYVRPADARASKAEVWKTKANASLYVKPRTASINWRTQRPIYDVRNQRRLTPEEAASVDFMKDGFQWFALPPAEVDSLVATVPEPGRVQVDVKDAAGNGMRGIPVEVAITRGKVTLAKVSGVSGEPIVLPGSLLARGAGHASAVELLSGKSAEATALRAPGPRARSAGDPALKKFAARKQMALIVALTPAQEKDAKLSALAKQIVARFEKAGRKARMGRVAPGGVVQSLQPLASPHRFPQWKTSDADLVLFGTPQSNVLILDQLRGEIFPKNFEIPAAGAGMAVITKSPFVGEYDVLNVVARDAAGVQAWLKSWE